MGFGGPAALVEGSQKGMTRVAQRVDKGLENSYGSVCVESTLRRALELPARVELLNALFF